MSLTIHGVIYLSVTILHTTNSDCDTKTVVAHTPVDSWMGVYELDLIQ
jgi:hypothetical protein